MTAGEAFEDILDINEILHSIKKRNDSNTPNVVDMKVADLLVHYRDILHREMKITKLEAYRDNK